MAEKSPESSPSQDSSLASPDKALSQDEIDSLLGFNGPTAETKNATGIHALLDSSLKNFDRLPMLEVVFDRFVRMVSTSLRNFTSDNVDVDIRGLTSLRFGDYINAIPMPALLSIFRAVEWDNYGIVTTDSSLIYSMVDTLFGGKKAARPIRAEGRTYTMIEQGIVKHMTELLLNDMAAAFDPLSPTTFELERLETNPRFATIAHNPDAAILLQLRVDMEGRGGNIEILLPYATIEPIRELLTQVFIGDKFGKDIVWENHLNKEISHADFKVKAILAEKYLTLSEVMQFKVGTTLIFDQTPDDDIFLESNGILLLSGKMGRKNDHIACRIQRFYNPSKSTS